MRLLKGLLAIGVLTSVVGCSPISVNHDYDPGYDFSQLRTYDWMTIQIPAGASELKLKRFMRAIDAELQRKGYQLTSNRPDFQIAMYAGAQQRVQIHDYGYSYRGGRQIDVSHYTEGTIVIDFVDVEQEMFWRGTATGVMEDLSPEQQEHKAAEAATKLLEVFPPGK